MPLSDALCKRVVAGGFSTGAGLALDLASRVVGITAVFAVSPPLRLQDFSVRFLPVIGAWNRTMNLMKMENAKMVFIKNSPENPHINYHRNPVNGVRELGFLMASLERKLPRIKVPALVVQADGDPIVDPKGSRKVFERLGSKDKEYRLVNFRPPRHSAGPRGGSGFTATIGNFIQRVAPS